MESNWDSGLCGNTFLAVVNSVAQKASVFVGAYGFNSTLLFAGKAGTHHGSDKHTSLLRLGINYVCKMYYSKGPWFIINAQDNKLECLLQATISVAPNICE